MASRVSIQWTETGARPSESGGDTVYSATGEIVCDAVTAQTRDLAADLPEHPVELGVATTDNVVPHPRNVSFEAHFSSAAFDEELLGSRSTVKITNGDVKVVTDNSGLDRAAVALEYLQEFVDNGQEVDIIGLPYGDLEGYQIASVSMSQSQGTGAQLVPVISARQRVTVSASEVDAPAPQVERTRRSQNQGSQPATEPTEQTARERNASLADSLLHTVGNLTG